MAAQCQLRRPTVTPDVFPQEEENRSRRPLEICLLEVAPGKFQAEILCWVGEPEEASGRRSSRSGSRADLLRG